MLRNPVDTQKPTHYEVLGVGTDATPDQIKSAYHALARKYHPDKGGDAGNFTKINRAYEYLTGGSKVILETLRVPLEIFDAFEIAIDNCNLTKLDQLYAQFPITFNEEYVRRAVTNFAEALRRNTMIYDRVNTLLWLLNHNAEGNISIETSVTVTQRDYIDTVRNGVVISTTYEDYYKNYNWQTTLLGFAMFNKETVLINSLIKIPGIRLDNILIPTSAKREEYATGLEFAALQDWSDVIAAYLNKQRCQTPKVQELGNAIYNARQKGYYATKNLLSEYRSKHYRYNPFKFGYNLEWHEHVDISWAATYNAVPENFKIAVNDFIYTCKYVYNAVFCRQGLYNAVFLIAGAALTAFFTYAGFSAAVVITSQNLLEWAILGIMCAYIISVSLLGKAHKDLNQSYLDFVHITYDRVINNAKEFVYGCWQKVRNSVSAMFTRTQPEVSSPAQQDQVQNASAATATQPDATQSWLNYRLPKLCFTFCSAPVEQKDSVRDHESDDQPNLKIYKNRIVS